jgi:uncharacterized membrane protein YkoI
MKNRFRKWTLTSTCSLIVLVSFELPVTCADGGDNPIEIVDFLVAARISLASAVTAAQSECKDGIPFKAGNSRQRPRHAFEVLLLTSDGKVVRVEIDTNCGEVLDSEEEPRTPAEVRELRRTVRRARVGLAEAIGAAVKRAGGDAVRGELRAEEKKVKAAIIVLLRGEESEIAIERIPRVNDNELELFVVN